MNKTIFRNVLAACTIVMFASLAVTLFFLNSYFTGIEERNLVGEAGLAAAAVERSGAVAIDDYAKAGYRVTLIDTDGEVISDTVADPATMDNHAGREEVQEAMSYGRGSARRLSDTLSETSIYAAARLSDGKVLRVGLTQHSVFRLTLGALPYMVMVLVAAFALSIFISHRISRRIIEPLNRIDLDHPLENETYEELSPLLTRIENQNRQIERQMDTIRHRQKELATITGDMTEGMVILNALDAVVSINTSALRVLGGDQSCVGRNIITVERSIDFLNCLQEAKEKGRSEYMLERGGYVHRVSCSCIRDDNGKLIGSCVLIVDETEKAFSEAMRKEFSANVSHELKTPLQTILASSELLKNGMVRDADREAFAEKIHSEAERLVTLIDDIIRLSQLDETKDYRKEEIDLAEVAKQTADALSGAAAARGVSLVCETEKVSTMGVPRLAQEIIFNLVDNAIRYNREGGHVWVNLTGDGVLTVRDDGIGIPEEHQGRIFERFYRVDSSHSRATGGTGLGLSIVKHACIAIGAKLSLRSQEGVGTTFSVRFQPVEQ